MSSNEKIQMREDLVKGLKLAEYRMLRDKAMRNLPVINRDDKGNVRKISARELFTKLYNEPVPQY